MHKVKRNEAPEGLTEFSKEFQKRYNKEININSEWTTFGSNKLKKAIVDNLEKMYAGKCAYCESDIKSNSFANIEHFRPKSKFPLLCYEYDNMHYVCSACNTYKRDKFDEKMIDPSIDEPEKHIKYQGYTAIYFDGRGQIMIDTLKINDNERINVRAELFDILKNMLESAEGYFILKDKLTGEDKENAIKLAKSQLETILKYCEHGQIYCTMCKNNFKESAIKLYNELNG